MKTILIVEDDHGIRHILEIFLEEIGYRVLSVSDGDSGIELLNNGSQAIDVLITDMHMMPGMSCGNDVAKAGRDKYGGEIIIILMYSPKGAGSIPPIENLYDKIRNKPVNLLELQEILVELTKLL